MASAHHVQTSASARLSSRGLVRVALRVALIVMLAQLLLTPASAATVTLTVAIPSFDATNIQGFQVNGNAALVGGVIRLAPATTNQAGSAFWKNRVSLANQRSFSSYFVLAFPNVGGITPGGADGIVFTIQTQSNTAGSAGGGIGYEGITPSVGVEFDTWQNGAPTNDPDDNHVGLDVGGNVTSVITSPAPGTLEGNTWHVWADYNGATKSLQVRMSPTNSRSTSTLVLDVTRDLSADIGQDVFVGFTGGTGDAFENNDVQSFYFVNNYQPIDTNASPPNIYNAGASQVAVVPSPASISAGTTSTVTATVRDVAGAVMANQPVTFTTTFGSLGSTTGVTNASGQVAVTLNSGPIAGTATVRATAAGGIYGEASVTVIAQTCPCKMYMPLYVQPKTITQ